MLRFYTIGFCILICCDTFVQLAFKLAAMTSAPLTFDLACLMRLVVDKWVYFAVIGYLGSFATYMTLLKHAPVGPAFAVTHLEVITTALAAVVILHESLSLVQIAGGAFIVAGVIVLALEVRGEDAKRAGELKAPVAKEPAAHG